jgi:broad specificity polyphosphatase/5'/3'-nucleotidase SurE
VSWLLTSRHLQCHEPLALNVNFPNAPTSNSEFAWSRIGTFQLYNLTFKNAPPYGLAFLLNDPSAASFWQADDEAVVNATRVSVTAMQVSFDHSPIVQHWLRRHLRRLFR